MCVHGGSEESVSVLALRAVFPSCVLSGVCPFLVQRVFVRVGSEVCGPPC